MSISLLGLKAKDNRYVRNRTHFRLHNRIHAMNVTTLGMNLYAKYRNQYFADVPQNILLEKLSLHDKEKRLSIITLREMGYTGDRNLGYRIFEFYGYSKDELSEDDKKRFMELLDEMHSITARYDYTFYKKHNLINADNSLKPVALKIATIEKLADLVERGESLVSPEEFGRLKMLPAHDFIQDPTPMELEMTIYLESMYSRLTPPNTLIEFYKFTSLQGPRACESLFSH